MAHHQHHGADYEAQLSRSMQSRPTSAKATAMPVISEDEMLAEADEPPDPRPKSTFNKHTLPLNVRRESLLTQALHSESESHDEGSRQADYFKLPSISSTASSQSVHSVDDFTSDDGHISTSTRASTPASPRTAMSIPKIRFPSRQNSNLSSTDSHHEADQSQSEEATVEAKLGRKRCIMFACGKKDNITTPKPASILTSEVKAPEPAKRACTIKFACPFKASNAKSEEPARIICRRLSPAPPRKHTNALGTAFSRRHRDSDATIRDESPTTPKGTSSPLSPQRPKPRRMNSNSDMRRAEACRFHEFASEEEEHEDWTQESTCHRSRLTVDDTLKKEHDIRKLAEEVDEEEAIEREIKDNLSDDDDSDDDVFSDDSDEGFQSDDEEGFADSDDEDGSDGDYEWWVPRRSAAASPYVGNGVFRPVSGRTYSDSSLESSDGQMSPKTHGRKAGNRTLPLNIRARTPDLPDSTDFVCGTLDEDRPQEQAYLRALAARKASRHKTTPQDIDPTFPISDPETDSDDAKRDNVKPSKLHEESDQFMHGRPSDDDHVQEHRGRRLNDTPPKRLHFESPKRLRSPPPPKKSCATHRSLAPRMLFGGNRSPRKHLSPGPGNRMTSPPPSRRGSITASPTPAARYGIPFLSNHMNHLTHTASLPRSPHPFFRKRNSSPPPPARMTNDDDEEDEDDDEGSATDRPNDSHRYTRGAIDIAQGLERKRLKRREKFHKQYQRKEEKKERKGGKKRPTPGQGAERMRQVGLECAVYRGTRMLSI